MSANETRYGNICFDSTSDQQTYQNDAILGENAYESPYRMLTQNSTWSRTTEGNENISTELEEKALRQKEAISLKLKIVLGVLFILVTIVLVEATLLLTAYQPLKGTPNDVFSTTVEEITTETSTLALNTDSTQTATIIQTAETSTSLYSSTPLQKPRSCLDYKNAGNRSSGIYKIFSEDGQNSYDAYCDMETDGGGWTLVASIHEDDIKKKCSVKDRWSTFAETASNGRPKTAWENKETFGAVSNCTSDDYKNRGYYSITADDVMIWHVPDDSSIDSMRKMAKVRYRTKNQFLRDVGGNLFSVFEDYYSLDIRGGYSNAVEYAERSRTNRVNSVLNARKNQITSVLDDWYAYTTVYYVTGHDLIRDEELYDTYGNMISMDTSVFSPTPNIYYNSEMWWGEYTRQKFSTIATATQPFMMVGAIENRYLEHSYIKLEIFAYQQNQPGNHDTIDNWLKMGNFTLFYRSIQYVVDTYNTACEFHYIVYNEKEWRSARPSAFRLDDSDITTSSRSIKYIIEGYPTNIVMGYVLLTRNSSTPVYKIWLDEVARIVLEGISEIPDLFDAFAGSDGLAVPVTFDVGDESTILDTIPFNLHTSVEPGYLQLRAYNQIGYPNVLCSGVRMTYHPSEFICIGGISSTAGSKGTCGDFAGWEGEAEPNIHAGSHSEEDIDTSILIFYR